MMKPSTALFSRLLMETKRAAILYHYPCPDGAFAALAAHLYFSHTSTSPLFFPNTVYSPLRVEDLPLHEIDDVYLLDFVGPAGFVQKLAPQVRSVVVLDHHKTALENLGADTSENVTWVIDMERSGATIAYDFFKEKMEMGNGIDSERCELAVREFERVRQLFEYIEDGDLWRWQFHNSKSFSSGLKDSSIEFSASLNPSLFQQLLSLDLESIINQGMVSLSHKQKLINEVLEQSYAIALGGGAFGNCLAVFADSVSELRSELGHQLANKSHTMNLRYVESAFKLLPLDNLGALELLYRVPELQNDQLLKISLRSVKNEDTTTISQEFGGGGHRNASSFMLTSAELERWKL